MFRMWAQVCLGLVIIAPMLLMFPVPGAAQSTEAMVGPGETIYLRGEPRPYGVNDDAVTAVQANTLRRPSWAGAENNVGAVAAFLFLVGLTVLVFLAMDLITRMRGDAASRSGSLSRAMGPARSASVTMSPGAILAMGETGKEPTETPTPYTGLRRRQRKDPRRNSVRRFAEKHPVLRFHPRAGKPFMKTRTQI